MKRAMVDAPLGDDVWGDDPTVNRLEALVAERLGKEAAVLVTSGTQSNLCAIMAHCGRGDEYIVGDMAHAFRWEAGGAAVLGSIQPQTVPMFADGLVDPAAIDAAVKPEDTHHARTKLVCFENTKDGAVQSVERMREATDVARRHGLATHLDGARMWNAVVTLGISGAELVADFDTVSLCLSKGLGAPMGSVLSGRADVMAEARRTRKMLGGGLRQAGMIAAAGIYALDNNIDRLADDHANAAALAAALGEIDGVTVSAQNTNMIFVAVTNAPLDIEAQLIDAGVNSVWSHGADGSASTRLVTHLGVTADDIAPAAEAIRSLT